MVMSCIFYFLTKNVVLDLAFFSFYHFKRLPILTNLRIALQQKYQHYDAQVSAFMDQLAAYSDEQLNTKPADGGWSPIQVLHHLLLVEEGTLAYVRKKLSFNPTLEKTGLASR